jgi:hypothetical protein
MLRRNDGRMNEKEDIGQNPQHIIYGKTKMLQKRYLNQTINLVGFTRIFHQYGFRARRRKAFLTGKSTYLKTTGCISSFVD